MINIWVSTHSCAEKCHSKTALYVLSILSHAYKIIIDSGVGAPGHVREVVYGLNNIYKRFLSMLNTTVQMPGASSYDSQMEIHTSTKNTDINLAREFQKHISDPTRAHGLLDNGKDRKNASKGKCT